MGSETNELMKELLRQLDQKDIETMIEMDYVQRSENQPNTLTWESDVIEKMRALTFNLVTLFPSMFKIVVAKMVLDEEGEEDPFLLESPDEGDFDVAIMDVLNGKLFFYSLVDGVSLNQANEIQKRLSKVFQYQTHSKE